ncbi:MAG: chemotaxis protein CheW [Thalassobium sp.]|nr:MAG: chemotaxis protein CheW [Oceanospirillales bacterium]PHQ88147.1 MAG: chemotaxis protein CheW [Thalassobium sp.]
MTQVVTTTVEKNIQVDCLLVPLKDKHLLLPNVSVAEVIPFSHLLTTNSSADWMLGRIDWRGTLVPAICYEMLNNHSAPAPNPNARFIIVNGVGANADMPFYAILVQGIPKLMHVHKDEIQQVDAMNMGIFDGMAVTVDGDNAMIPDLERVEKELLAEV